MKSPLFLLLFIVSVNYGWGQSSTYGGIVSSYQQAVNDSYSAEWIVGDVITETFEKYNFTAISGLIDDSGLNPTTSLEQHDKYGIYSFPNPFSNTLTIQSDQLPDQLQFNNLRFEFFNTLGVKIETPIINHGKKEASFFTGDLTSGLYILKIKNASNKLLTHIKLIRE